MIYDRQLTISTGKRRTSTEWKRQIITVSQLYDRLQTPSRSLETMAEYRAMKKADQDALKDVGGFVGGTLNGPRRKSNAMIGRDIITLDFDNIPSGGADLLIERVESLGCGYCIYSTRKHTPEAPRVRVVIPTDRTMTPDEYEPCARRIAQQVNMGWIDPTTFEVSRLMYWPSCCADGEYLYKTKDAPLICVDFLLSTFANWRDVTTWPQVPGKSNEDIRKLIQKQADPETKEGIVGAFCRSYDIYRAIAELIPDVYMPVAGADDRYTFVGGSTTGGAIIYDGGKFLFSHHATDPCSGKLVNAFDLVRLHRFGDSDDNAAPGTPVGKMPSYTAMREYAQTLPDVQLATATAAADFAGLESAAEEDNSWKLKLDISQNGKLKSSLNNYALILEHDSRFKGKLRKDSFHDRIDADDLPWDRPADKPWDDTDSDHLRIWMSRAVEGSVSVSDINTAVNATADKNVYHPVHNYLNALAWDGTPRLDTLFIDYLGAEDSPYTRAVTRKAFTAAVARIMAPGCKYDNMTVLVGKQGRFKSTILAVMGGEWFSDSLRTFEGKEASEHLRGVWLIEISELQGFERSTTEAIKGFLSKLCDRYRPAYGHMLREFPRQCVFFGTTNAPDFLRDTTGNRRFWPIDIDRQERTKDVVKDLPGERDQLWAEAVARYRSGEPLFLADHVEAVALQIQEDHREVDAWEGMLLDFIEKPVPIDWDAWPLDRRRDYWAGQSYTGSGDSSPQLVKRDRVSATEFLCEALGRAPGNISPRDSVRVGKILRGIPGWEQSQKRYRTPYAQPRGYHRIK